MLRPAFLPPAARLTPLRGLSTPRLGLGDLSPHLGSAARRSDAYRGGTLTRWRYAAGRWLARRSRDSRSVLVTTHHHRIIRARARRRTAAPGRTPPAPLRRASAADAISPSRPSSCRPI